MTEPDRATLDHPICTDGSTPVDVTCYVRGDVSAPLRRQVEAVQDRLRALEGTPLVADTRVRQWPPRHPLDGSTATESDRERLVARFERWAEARGCSVRPAIRRREVPASLAGSGRTYPEICVPVVLLALAEPATGTDDPPLRGVVPYTIDYGTEESTTYTVDDWLTAAEQSTATAGRAGTPGGPSGTVDSD